MSGNTEHFQENRMPRGRPPEHEFDAQKVKRVEALKRRFHCETDQDLADLLHTHQPQISRWKRTGFDPVIEHLVDLLLKTA